MRIKLIYILIIISSSFVFGQKIRPEIKIIVDEISQSNYVPCRIISNGKKSVQFVRFQKLDSLAEKLELTCLIEDKSPAVRCASFSSLCLKDLNSAKQFLIAHLYDTEEVNIEKSCISNYSTVGDQFIESFVFTLWSKDSTMIENMKPFLKEIEYKLLNDPQIKLEYKSSIIRGMKPIPENYDLLRKIAVSSCEPYSLITLSQYKNTKDKQIIIDALKNNEIQSYAIHAVRSFPEKAFYPYIVEIFKNDWRKKRYSYAKWRMLYQALAQFPYENETFELFDKTLKSKKKFKRTTLGEYLLIAITKYPNPNFEKYKSRILELGIETDYFDRENYRE
ncbi:MAG: hypothetical protein ABJL44_07225 [Algibacter sp.]